MITMAGAIPHLYLTPTAPLLYRTNLRRPSPPRFMPPLATVSGGSSYWTNLDAEIDAHLRRAIKVKPPFSVYEPLHHFAFSSPVANTGSALCVASCDLFGGHNRDKAVATASALRLYQAAFYAHDQILEAHRPSSMDNGPYDPNIKLLAGVGLWPLGMELLARSDDPGSNNSGRVLRVIMELNRAIGSKGVIEGKYREKERRRSPSDGEGMRWCHVGEIGETSQKIEGRFHACAAVCGAILGGGSEDEIERLRSFGLNVGTLRGLLSRSGVGGGEEHGAVMKKVEEMRNLATKELKDFERKNVETLYDFVDIYLGFFNHG